MRIVLQPAYVLHHRSYRETSMLLDVFTEEHGRVSIIARGVRAKRSPLRSILQPFTPLLLSFQGKSELMTLQLAEPRSAPWFLTGECLLSGFYVNELLVNVLQKQDPQPKLFGIYQDTLQQLQGNKVDQKILRLFEKKLLTEMGYGLSLQKDYITGKPVDTDQFYQYCHEHGFTHCIQEIGDQLLHVFSGKSLLALANDDLSDETCLRDAKRLMRLLLTSILGVHQIHSRKLFL